MKTVHAKEEDHGSSLPQNDIRTIKAKAQRVIISGLSRTKDDLIGNRVQDVFKATNFEELVFHSLMVKEQLEKLGVFKKVVILMDTSKDPGADRNAYDVKFNVLEKRLLSGGIHTDVEPARMRSGLMGKLMFNNMFGRAETLSTEYHSDFKNRKEYYLTFRKPLKGDPDFSTSIGSYYTHTDFPPSGYNQTSAGLKTDFIIPSFGNIGSHTFQWDGVWRNLRALSRTTSFAVREEAGHSVKSSITKTAGTKYSLVEFILRTIGEDKHTFERDGRDDKILPNQGTYVKFMQEYAGLGGNTEFVKANAELQVNRTLLPDTVLQVSLAGGMMTKLDKEKSIAICDRFFLGGPLTLRGFDTNGIGAQSNGNFLGGDAYWLGAAHLYTPLPFRPGLGGFGQIFRSHFFINAGNQGNLSSDKSSKENMMDLLENYRLSCGAGIVLRLGGIARMELNYVYPIQYQRTDSVKSGLQFGLGISFF